jgi:hypothetical protein
MPPTDSQGRYSSIIFAAQYGGPPERAKALEHIVSAHWKPLYKYLRAQHSISHTEAWTIALNFLARVREADFFNRFDPAKSPVREFIRENLDQFTATPPARNAVVPSLSFDFSGAEEEFQADHREPGQSAREYYESEWVRNLFTLAVEELHTRLTSEGKAGDFSLFLNHDLQDRTGSERVGLENLASELSMPLAEAMASLAKTRQRFQSIVTDLIRSFTSSEAEFRREARTFFGA